MKLFRYKIVAIFGILIHLFAVAGLGASAVSEKVSEVGFFTNNGCVEVHCLLEHLNRKICEDAHCKTLHKDGLNGYCGDLHCKEVHKTLDSCADKHCMEVHRNERVKIDVNLCEEAHCRTLHRGQSTCTDRHCVETHKGSTDFGCKDVHCLIVHQNVEECNKEHCLKEHRNGAQEIPSVESVKPTDSTGTQKESVQRVKDGCTSRHCITAHQTRGTCKSAHCIQVHKNREVDQCTNVHCETVHLKRQECGNEHCAETHEEAVKAKELKRKREESSRVVFLPFFFRAGR